MSRKNEIDMLHGSIADKILLFALPLAASSVLQQLFNSADVAVVGRFSGSDALAAVGSTGPVIGLLVNLFVGLSIGANVTAAKYLGQENNEGVQRTVHTSVLLALISGIILLIVGQIAVRPILVVMSTPEDVLPLSMKYMRIYFLGMPFIMLYNFGSALLRSIGDTKRPLAALTIAGVINVILNLVFVVGFGMSVDGVAIATVCSNIVSSGLVTFFLCREKSAVHLNLKELKIHKRVLKEVAGIGIPAGVQGIVFSVSNICIQGTLNTFGSVVMAGSSAALNFEYYTFFVISAFGQTCTTFVSQNMGAGNLRRCKSVVVRAAAMAVAGVAVMSAVFIIFDKEFLSIFTTEPEVMQYGIIRMHAILGFQVFNVMIEVFSGALRGMGHSTIPAGIAILGVCGVRLLYVFLIFDYLGTLESLFAIYPISWGIAATAIITAFIITYRKKRKEELQTAQAV